MCHLCYFIVLMPSILFYNVEDKKREEKPMNKTGTVYSKAIDSTLKTTVQL